MKYLLLISLTLACISCHPAREIGTYPAFDEEYPARYRSRIKARQAVLTGILIIKRAGNEWRGSLINDFGVKAFDFIVTGGRCRLFNAIAFLDKWYIRRTISADLALLCSGREREGRRWTRDANGQVAFKNERRDIEYTFQPIIP